MHSFVMVIRSVYFGAQKRRKYAKSIGVNRSGFLFGKVSFWCLGWATLFYCGTP